MSTCITPGCCTCSDMKRCPDCGYTKHDKDFWLDHHLCRAQKIKKKEKTKAEKYDDSDLSDEAYFTQ